MFKKSFSLSSQTHRGTYATVILTWCSNQTATYITFILISLIPAHLIPRVKSFSHIDEENCLMLYSQCCPFTFHHLFFCLLFFHATRKCRFRNDSPEWIPIRILTGMSGMCRIRKVPTELRMFRDMLAISAACLLPFLFGRPDATM